MDDAFAAWLADHLTKVTGVIRRTGWRSNVPARDIEDFVSAALLRLLTIQLKSDFEGARWNLVQTVARRAAVDYVRWDVKQPKLAMLPEGEDELGRPDHRLGVIDALDAVGRLSDAEARSIIGHAAGLHDWEIAEAGVTLDAVTKRRARARQKLAA